ncbi:MAG: ornithine cyclodeaminase family protein [Chloroflexi bacterium]|nr:ornithine cyclodeaminase family protein [Chloroflexota bacterium]
MTLVLTEADVRSLIDMPAVVGWLEDATKAYGRGAARNLPRQRVKLPKGTLHLLAGADLGLGVVGVKSYTSFRDGTRFLILLYSAESGSLLAIVEGDYLGMMRTGAASGVATRHLARQEADTLALFGSGWQAQGQLLAIAAVRPLKEVRVYSRNPEHRQRFVAQMAGQITATLVASESPEAALDGAQIVTTITTARDPLFPEGLIAAGTHINAAGSNALIRRELDERLIRRANLVVVDSRAQARQECGDLLIPAERGWLDWDQLPELSDVVIGRAEGRRSDADVTIFESQGLGLQDVVVAAHVYQRAREAGLGQELPLFVK